MALRWTTVTFDAISKGFRRIMGYKHLWMLKAALDEPSRDRSLVDQARAVSLESARVATPLSNEFGTSSGACRAGDGSMERRFAARLTNSGRASRSFSATCREVIGRGWACWHGRSGHTGRTKRDWFSNLSGRSTR